MLEFWVDPASPYYRPALDDGRRLVALLRRRLLLPWLRHRWPGWASGHHHIAGGFTAWVKAGYPVEPFHR